MRDARVLDLFAGSGALGFEALSRGAAHATFVEADRRTAEALRRTANELALADRCDVLAMPAGRAARTVSGSFDIVFADPPYAAGFPLDALTALRGRGAIGPNSVLVYEHSSRTEPPQDPAFPRERTERYGDVALSFLRVEREAA